LNGRWQQPLGLSLLVERENRVNSGGSQRWDQARDYGTGVLSAEDGPMATIPQNGAHIVAQHADFSPVSSASPAAPGEYLTIYLVGMGATNPSVRSGTAAPSSPLAKVVVQPIRKCRFQSCDGRIRWAHARICRALPD
jgi:hypothetical protein